MLSYKVIIISLTYYILCKFIEIGDNFMSTKDNILKTLLANKGRYISGESMASELNVSRNTIWKSINKIKSEGINVITSKKLGYMIPKELDIISEYEIRENLIEELKEVPIYHLSTIDSTNDYAKRLANKDTPEYTLVIADTQTQGRGRMGRSFTSPLKSGIYMSVVLYPKASMEVSQLITSCVAVAISKAIDTLCKCETKIKWVNDIYLDGKKVSGTLTEGSINFETMSYNYAIVGTGINVRSVKGLFDEELSKVATSIEDVTGLQVSRNRLIAEVVNGMFYELNRIERKTFIKEYVKRSLIVGKDIIVNECGREVPAKAIGIDENANLIVEFSNGSTRALNSGEARVKDLKKN